jgi:hypothetical protein
MTYVVLFTERLATQNSTIATTINRPEKPNKTLFIWCLAGEANGTVVVDVAVVVPGLRLTVVRAVLDSDIPFELVRRLLGVPDCTPPVWAPPTLEPTADCGLCVVVWPDELEVAFSAIQTIVKQILAW